MTNLSIIHVITTLTKGGAENAIALLSKEQTKEAWVTVIPLKGEPELLVDLEENGVGVNLEILNRNFLVQICLLRKHLKSKSESTILHAHLPRAELLLAFSSFWKPRFNTRHNSESFWPKVPKILSRLLSRLATHRAKIICISENVRSFLNSERELSSKTPCEVIYYGYKPRFIRTRQKRGFSPNDRLIIGTVARLTNQKNIGFLIALASELRKKGLNFEIRLLGAGPLEASLKSEVKAQGLNEYVTFYGRNSNVFPFLSSLDVFILPSKYEGFGYVLLEAIDAGVPVLVSRIPVFYEVLGSKHLLYFDIGSTDECMKVLEILLQGKLSLTELIIMQDSRLALFSTERCLENHNRYYLGLD